MLSGDAAKKALEEEFNLLPYVLDILTSIENTKDQKDELTKKVCLFISFTYLASIERAVFGLALGLSSMGVLVLLTSIVLVLLASIIVWED